MSGPSRRQMLRGGALALLASAVAITMGVVAQGISPQPIGANQGRVLRIAASAPSTICPGPQTLAVPVGAQSIEPPGPVVVSAAALSPATLSDLASGGQGQPAASPNPLPLNDFGKVWLGEQTLQRPLPVQLRLGQAAPAQQERSGSAAMAAVQLAWGLSGDLRGIDALSCAPASGEAWLVGGSTTDGDRLKLLMTNPGSAPAILDVAVHGPEGPVDEQAPEGVVVPSGRQVVLQIDALAPGLKAVAVHVRARTGRVVAHLNHARLRGFTAGGVDNVVPSAPAAKTQIIPGVVLAPPGTAAIRVAVPGTESAVARVSLIGATGVQALPTGVATVLPGGIGEIAITGVPPGVYTAKVEADVPIVASGLSSPTLSGGEIAGTPAAVGKNVPPSELAWAASASPIDGTVVVALPPVAAPQPPESSTTTSTSPASGPASGAGTGPASATGSSANAPPGPSAGSGASAPPSTPSPTAAVLTSPTSPPAASQGAARTTLTTSLVLSAPGQQATVRMRDVQSSGVIGPERTAVVPAGQQLNLPLAGDVAAVLITLATDQNAASALYAGLLVQGSDAAGPLISVAAIRSGLASERAPRISQDPAVGVAR